MLSRHILRHIGPKRTQLKPSAVCISGNTFLSKSKGYIYVINAINSYFGRVTGCSKSDYTWFWLLQMHSLLLWWKIMEIEFPTKCINALWLITGFDFNANPRFPLNLCFLILSSTEASVSLGLKLYGQYLGHVLVIFFMRLFWFFKWRTLRFCKSVTHISRRRGAWVQRCRGAEV